MLVREGRAAASAWVESHAARDPRYRGAFFSGSTTAMPADGVLPATSDVDVVVVLDGPQAPPKLGKFTYGGALLEVTYLSLAALDPVEEVAASHYLAPSFSGDHLIADPSGHLGRLRDRIAPGFAHPDAVRMRCEDVLARLDARLRPPDPAAPWPEQVMAWMFPTSLTAVFVGVAGLRPPTVRRRYLVAREVLRMHGMASWYEDLLRLLSCADADRQAVQKHLDQLSATFDMAAAVSRTPFFFSTDITLAARPVAIDGSQALIGHGDHREAVFWLIATFARCQQILALDGSAGQRREGGRMFRAAVGDLLGLGDPADLVGRQASLRELLPDLRAAAEAIASKPKRP